MTNSVSEAKKKSQSARLALYFISLFSMIIIVGLPVLAILLFAIFPEINGLSLAKPFSAIGPVLEEDSLVQAIINSILLSSAVTITSALIAVPLAYMRSRMPDGTGKIWDALFLMPFLIPPYIGSMSWIQLLQNNGYIQQIFGVNFGPELFSFFGMTLVMALHLFPLIYFSASVSFGVVGRKYGEVAMLFGGRFRQVFFGINLPLVTPAVLASGLIVFILTIEEFGTPEILGSRFGFEVIVTSIHEKFSDWPIDLPGASVLSVLLIMIAFCAYRLQGYIAKRFESRIEVQKMTGAQNWPSKKEKFLAISVFSIVALLAVVLPILSIGVSSFMITLTGGLEADNFGWQNYAKIFKVDGEAWKAISTSLGLAFFAAVATSVIGMIVSFTVVRLRMRGTALLDFLSILPNSIPGMAIAVGLILTWNQSFWPVSPYNTLAILLMAYLCLMLPYPIRMVTSALKQLPSSLDEASYIAGASEWTVIRRILAPLLIPSALAAAFIVFAISTRELVSSIMLAPPGVETVATYVFHQFDQGSVNTGMAMSLVTILLSGGIIALARNYQGGKTS